MTETTEAQEIAKLSGLNVKALEDLTMPVVNVSNFTQLKSLERFMENPLAHRVSFNTENIDDFMIYCLNNLKNSLIPTICIDSKSMMVETIFNNGDQTSPAWGDITAKLKLNRSIDFNALLNNLESISQKDIINFFIDYEENIQFFAKDSKEINFNTAINSFRNVKITNTKQSDNDIGDGFNSKKSISESTEIAAGKNIIPFYFSFICEPYSGFNHATFLCKISGINDGDDNIFFNSRIKRYEKNIELFSKELKDKIKRSLGNSFNIYLGSIEHGNANIRSGS